MESTVVKGGTVVSAHLAHVADMLKEGGVITSTRSKLADDAALDAFGHYAVPGGVDSQRDAATR